ncbi:DUF3846 domain-containing protein (plasmid) [Streptomyces poriferorum]|uniref:DUF3846 domain-containing protein n=1 Tax=Streptomyces poriferorum TaxID=2798799 RepID=A0ABY9J105_9ACTN|nr:MULTISPECIES: DUF3846 domain-containing protein [unclassified Streptomyces]WLQ53921.1 DUF3846 domain-containing protein [Streptomyces sp. Alt1]WLQ61503.1 DUF3846 domain-containing protein [Streptomyces sp. Alt2]
MTGTQRLAIRLEADGRFELIEWPTVGTLQTLYTAIGCRAVDAVDISGDLTMWLDDEGMLTGLPVNVGATALYAAHKTPHQTYHGTAVITGGTDRHGDTLPLTTDQVMAIVEFHCTVGEATIPAQRTK